MLAGGAGQAAPPMLARRGEGEEERALGSVLVTPKPHLPPSRRPHTTLARARLTFTPARVRARPKAPPAPLAYPQTPARAAARSNTTHTHTTLHLARFSYAPSCHTHTSTPAAASWLATPKLTDHGPYTGPSSPINTAHPPITTRSPVALARRPSARLSPQVPHPISSPSVSSAFPPDPPLWCPRPRQLACGGRRT
jgi:hypothetical protein